MSGIRTLFLNRIGGQIALLILVSLVAIHAVIGVSLYVIQPERFGPPDEGLAQLSAAVKLVAATPKAERTAALARASSVFPRFQLTLASAAPVAVMADASERRFRALASALGAAFKIAPLSAASVAITLPDGDIVTAAMPPEHPPRIGGPLILSAMFILVSVTLLGLWAALALRNPLSAFAQAAENFSLDDQVAALPERGPEEIRAVARAFNRMRGRIKTLVDDRTRLFTAMSHDLRTPITRLRLRSEFIADAELRGQMLRDLDQMKTMTESVLSFLRDGQSREAESPVDIASGLQTIADDFADLGHAVTYEGPDHLTLVIRPNEMHRAVVNLVDNAARYGSVVSIRLSAPGSVVHIDVEDNGPGIPDPDKTAMLEPFARGDAARAMDEGAGFGLGLAIARAIAEAHGGTLTLNDGVPQGLIARIALPVSAAPH